MNRVYGTGTVHYANFCLFIVHQEKLFIESMNVLQVLHRNGSPTLQTAARVDAFKAYKRIASQINDHVGDRGDSFEQVKLLRQNGKICAGNTIGVDKVLGEYFLSGKDGSFNNIDGRLVIDLEPRIELSHG